MKNKQKQIEKQKGKDKEERQKLLRQINRLECDRDTELARIRKFTSRPGLFPLLARKRHDLESEMKKSFDDRLDALKQRLNVLNPRISIDQGGDYEGQEEEEEEHARKRRCCAPPVSPDTSDASHRDDLTSNNNKTTNLLESFCCNPRGGEEIGGGILVDMTSQEDEENSSSQQSFDPSDDEVIESDCPDEDDEYEDEDESDNDTLQEDESSFREESLYDVDSDDETAVLEVVERDSDDDDEGCDSDIETRRKPFVDESLNPLNGTLEVVELDSSDDEDTNTGKMGNSLVRNSDNDEDASTLGDNDDDTYPDNEIDFTISVSNPSEKSVGLHNISTTSSEALSEKRSQDEEQEESDAESNEALFIESDHSSSDEDEMDNASGKETNYILIDDDDDSDTESEASFESNSKTKTKRCNNLGDAVEGDGKADCGREDVSNIASEMDETICNSNISDSKDGDEDQQNQDEDDDLDLEDYEGNTAEIEYIQRSNLTMAIQGFRSKASHASRVKDVQHTTGAASDSPASVSPSSHYDPLSIEHLDKVYYKHRCYRMKTGTNVRDYSTVGILHFLPAVKHNMPFARCVLVVPFEDTILGIEDEDVNFAADYKPSSHVQVYNQVADLPVNDLSELSEEVETVPLLIYEPQVPGNWQCFGYFNDKTCVKRTGKRNEMKLLDLFVGAGGMSLGYRNAGFKRVAAIDKDSVAIETLRMNGHGEYVHKGCVRDFLKSLEDPLCRDFIGRVDHVHVSAPCQGFSGKNRRGGLNDEANNQLSMCIVEAVRILKCTTAVFENVLGMWRRKHLHYIKNIVKELMKLGYQVRCATLKACDYGDPQKRPRFFMFISKSSAPPPLIPVKTHGDEPHLLPFVTVKDALSGLENIEEGRIYNNRCKSTTVQPGNHGVIRLDAHGLAPAVCASSIPPFHYEEDRCISVREAANLQSFPVDYIFCGELNDQYRQVGNAVPIELATAVAQSVRPILSYTYED